MTSTSTCTSYTRAVNALEYGWEDGSFVLLDSDYVVRGHGKDGNATLALGMLVNSNYSAF